MQMKREINKRFFVYTYILQIGLSYKAEFEAF